jgi:hypothetical protein
MRTHLLRRRRFQKTPWHNLSAMASVGLNFIITLESKVSRISLNQILPRQRRIKISTVAGTPRDQAGTAPRSRCGVANSQQSPPATARLQQCRDSGIILESQGNESCCISLQRKSWQDLEFVLSWWCTYETNWK